MRFWDTSAIIPLLYRQEFSKVAGQYLKENNNLVVARTTIVEVHSMLARLMRDKQLKKAGYSEAIIMLNHISATWAVIAPSDRMFELASQLPYSQGLTTADSIQLASAIVWTTETPLEKPFVCFDTRLAKAAKACGFNVLSY